MKINLVTKAFTLLMIIGLLVCGILLVTMQPASATSAPLRFEVHPQYDLVYAMGWNEGVELTLTVTNEDGEVLTEITVIVGRAPWDPNLVAADFSLTGFDFQPGQTLTSVGDGLTKELVIPNPILTEINDVTDTVSGSGTPGARMLVSANLPGVTFFRWKSIDVNGNWTVDFTIASDPGDTPGAMDLIPGTTGSAEEYDGDDQTWADDWRIPAPYAQVNPVQDQVSGLGMPIGTVLTLTISITDSVVFTSDPTPIIENPDNPDDISARFDMKGFDVQAGQHLTTSSAEVSSTYTVTVFAITAIDTTLDMVSGVATPGVQVYICANLLDSCAIRHPLADGSGNWVADFQHPGAGGDEQEIVDIKAGSSGNGNETDALLNQTWSAWYVPNPRFEARPNIDQVRGWEWMQGEILTLEVGGHEITGTVGVTPWDPELSYIEFNLGGVYDIKPDDVISLTNGIITKTTMVTDLEITGFNLVDDTVMGKAAPESNVDLWACDLNNCTNVYRHVTADVDGNWMADFSVPGGQPDEQGTFDLISGTWVDSQQVDTDSDATMYGIFLPFNIYLPAVHR